MYSNTSFVFSYLQLQCFRFIELFTSLWETTTTTTRHCSPAKQYQERILLRQRGHTVLLLGSWIVWRLWSLSTPHCLLCPSPPPTPAQLKLPLFIYEFYKRDKVFCWSSAISVTKRKSDVEFPAKFFTFQYRKNTRDCLRLVFTGIFSRGGACIPFQYRMYSLRVFSVLATNCSNRNITKIHINIEPRKDGSYVSHSTEGDELLQRQISVHQNRLRCQCLATSLLPLMPSAAGRYLLDEEALRQDP